MDVGITLLVEVGRNAQAFRPATDNRLRRGDRLDHDIAQGAGLDQLAFTRNHRRFNGQQLTTDLGPGQASDLPHLILLLGQTITELAHPEEVLQLLASDLHSHLLEA
ncbi:hypothetical protein D3C77_593090 [compost metagenome]